jgi:hypothetical protein
MKEEKEITKAAAVGAGLASACFLKKTSPQLGFPSITSLSFDAWYLDSYLKITGRKSVCFLMNH